jgi:hypothetical protein
MKKTINIDTIAQELGIDRDKFEQWKKNNLSDVRLLLLAPA